MIRVSPGYILCLAGQFIFKPQKSTIIHSLENEAEIASYLETV